MNITYDLSHLLGYIGIFATIIFGIWGIYAAIKNRLFVRTTFVLNKSIALFDTIVKNLPKLSINYKGSPISQNLLLIEGTLINTGNKDILPTMIEEPICLNLPEDYKWLTAKIISASKNVKADILISDPILTINSGLLKIKEYIRFQALIQAPLDSNVPNIVNKIDKIIKYFHRIADMPKIKNINLVNIDINTYQMVWITILLIFFSILSSFFAYDIATTKPYMQTLYSFEKPNKESVKIIISKTEEDKFTIKGIDLPYDQTLTVKEFMSKSKKIGEIPINYPGKKLGIIINIIVSIGCLILLISILRYYKMKKSFAQISTIKE